MKPEDHERDFWEAKAAASEQSAIESIAADPLAWEGPMLESCLEQITPLVGKLGGNWRVLDLGCGIGRLTLPLAARHPQLTFVGVDISRAMVDRARQRGAGFTNLEFAVCDGRTLPALGSAFAGAYSMITLQHIPRIAQQSYIEQVGRLLTRSGFFRFQVLEGIGESFMWSLLDVPAIEKACKAGGLKVTALDRVAPFQPDADVTVLWVTAEKY